MGPPSAAGTGWPLAAMKAANSPTVRIANRIASFAFIFTFMVVLLWVLGVFLIGSSVASDFSNATSVPKRANRTVRCAPAAFLRKTWVNQGFGRVWSFFPVRQRPAMPNKSASG